MNEELAALGPYFALDALPADPARHGWRRLADLCEPGPLEARTADVRQVLSGTSGVEVEERVAASTVSLGLFSRLLSPALGAAALGVPAPPLALDTTWWRPFESGPWPLAVDPAGHPPGLDEALSSLVDRFATGFGLSRTILWGNASSALFGAVAGLRASRPDLVPAAAAFAVATLGRPPYAGTGDVVRGAFVRRSCCLYYRVPGGGYCGDCVLESRRRAGGR